MSEELSRLMIRRILADVGASPEAPGKVGLMEPQLVLANTLTIKYDGGNIDHDIYAGQLSFQENNYLRGLLVDLTVDDIPEYLFVFRMNNLPIHAAKSLYEQVDLGETYLKVLQEESESWVEASIYFKARLLADFEKIVTHGLLWEDCSSHEDLYQAAIDLIQEKG